MVALAPWLKAARGQSTTTEAENTESRYFWHLAHADLQTLSVAIGFSVMGRFGSLFLALSARCTSEFLAFGARISGVYIGMNFWHLAHATEPVARQVVRSARARSARGSMAPQSPSCTCHHGFSWYNSWHLTHASTCDHSRFSASADGSPRLNFWHPTYIANTAQSLFLGIQRTQSSVTATHRAGDAHAG